MTPVMLGAWMLLAAASGPTPTAADPAQGAAQAPAPAVAEKPKVDPDKKICESEQVTGSLFPRRVCLTRAQWDQRTQAAHNAMEQLNRSTQHLASDH